MFDAVFYYRVFLLIQNLADVEITEALVLPSDARGYEATNTTGNTIDKSWIIENFRVLPLRWLLSTLRSVTLRYVM
jgi:hypothetical protein